MAAAIRPNYIGASEARVGIDGKGKVTVQLDMTDIGTGTYTILAQIAASSLGLPVAAIDVQLGDSNFSRAPPDLVGLGGRPVPGLQSIMPASD